MEEHAKSTTPKREDIEIKLHGWTGEPPFGFEAYHKKTGKKLADITLPEETSGISEEEALNYLENIGVIQEKSNPQIPKTKASSEALVEKNSLGTDEPDIDMLAMFFLAHSIPHIETAASPGIVVNPKIAKSSPCRCAVIDDSELCFSRGIIGALSEGQKEAYCNPKTYFESPALKERIGKFKEAVAAAQEKIKDVPKGERLEPWLLAMSEELEKRGIEV